MNKDKKKNLKEQSFTKNFPHILKNNRISPLDKLVYAQIHSLSQVEGYCWATNKNLSEMLATSPRNIQLSITKLIDENLITRVLSTSQRKLFLVEMKEPTPTDVRTYTQHMKEPTPTDVRTYTQHMKEPTYIIDNRIDNLKDNRIDNNNSKNLDLVEGIDKEVKSVVSNTSTNPPEGGDLIPGNDDGIDISNLIKPEVIIPLEEKIESNKIKHSTKEESSDIVIGNIDDVFSYEEKKNALNYTSTKEESEIDIEYLNILSKEELEAELKKLKN